MGSEKETEKTAKADKPKRSILKRILKIIGCIFIFILLMLFIHPLWLGPVAKWAANKFVPDATKTPFHIDRIDLNLYTGRFAMEGLELQNPTNYNKREAFKLKRLAVDFDTLSALGDVVKIHKIEIEGADASCVLKVTGALPPSFNLNFLDIANGKENEKLAAMSEKEREAYLQQKKEENRRKKKEKEELAKSGKQGPGKRVMIKELIIKDTGVGIGSDSVGVVPIPLPSLKFTDIGGNPEVEVKSGDGAKKEEGLTLENAWLAVWEQIKKAEPAVAAAWNGLSKPVDWILYGVGNPAELLGDLGGAVLDAGGKALDAMKGTGGAVLEKGGKALDAMKDVGGSALEKGGKLLNSVNPF